MKRLSLVFALLLVASTLGFSQISFGLKGGLNFSKLPKNLEGGVGKIVTALDDVYTGYHFGGVVYLGVASWFAQLELLYSQTGQDMYLGGENGVNFETRFRNIDVPLNLGFRLGPLKLGAGPVLSYLIKNDDTLGPDINFEQKLKELTVGYQAGVGLKIGTLLLDLKYQGNLTNYGDQITIGGQTFDFDRRPHNFILSLGLLF